MPRTTSQQDMPSFGPIATLEGLREHLQWAIELEHFTVPPYLCALYSLDSDRNPEAAEILSSVLIEEMLHLTMAANILNAVGGQPRLESPQMLAPYPRCMPHGGQTFEVSLLRFGPEALEQFLRIEEPAAKGAVPETDRYETIGQFYDAIRQGLRDLCANLGEARLFCGAPARQVPAARGYTGSGRLFAVSDLATSLAAIDEIVEQGEGAAHVDVWDGDRDMFHPERDEVGHYYRFQELKLGRRYRRGDSPLSGPTGDLVKIDWAGVRPMQANPRTTDHAPGSPIRMAQEEFNGSYRALLHLLEQGFNGNPEGLEAAARAMYGLRAQAQALMEMPTEDGLATAGPTFEYVDSSHQVAGVTGATEGPKATAS
jgi:hypothetical protein